MNPKREGKDCIFVFISKEFKMSVKNKKTTALAVIFAFVLIVFCFPGVLPAIGTAFANAGVILLPYWEIVKSVVETGVTLHDAHQLVTTLMSLEWMQKRWKALTNKRNPNVSPSLPSKTGEEVVFDFGDEEPVEKSLDDRKVKESRIEIPQKKT